jgi:hypothetical protein
VIRMTNQRLGVAPGRAELERMLAPKRNPEPHSPPPQRKPDLLMKRNRMSKWQRELVAWAAINGVNGARVEFGGKHPKVVGEIDGMPFCRAIAGSPSDGARAITKARADIKRAAREIAASVLGRTRSRPEPTREG